jgi:hypothetical protein
VALVITDVSEEHIVSIIRVKRISELRTALAVTSSEGILTRATWHHIPEGGLAFLKITAVKT